MSFSKSLTALMLGSTLVSLPAFSQEEAPQYKQEASVQALGAFLKDTTDNGVRHSSTYSGGVLGSYRYFFNQHYGVEVNYGWTRNTLDYAGISSLKADSYEVTGNFVYRLKPLLNNRLTPFALAGGGAVVFNPTYVSSYNGQARATAVYGAGADFNLTKTGNVFFRAEYRGLIYLSPTFDQPVLNGLERITHRAEPSAGIGFRF